MNCLTKRKALISLSFLRSLKFTLPKKNFEKKPSHFLFFAMIGVRRAHDVAVVVDLCAMRTQLGRSLMGAKDVREKHLFSKNDVFSSVWNELDGDGDVQTPGTVWLEPERESARSIARDRANPR